MDSFELNKIIAAVLLVALIIIGIGKLSDAIFYVEKPKTPGYVVEVEQAATAGTETKSDTMKRPLCHPGFQQEFIRIFQKGVVGLGILGS